MIPENPNEMSQNVLLLDVETSNFIIQNWNRGEKLKKTLLSGVTDYQGHGLIFYHFTVSFGVLLLDMH